MGWLGIGVGWVGCGKGKNDFLINFEIFSKNKFDGVALGVLVGVGWGPGARVT